MYIQFSNIQDQNGFLDNKLKFEDIRKPDSIDESIIDIGPNVTMNIVNSVFKDISGSKNIYTYIKIL